MVRCNFRRSRLVLAGTLVCYCVLPGCGGSDRPKTIPVTGRVTINGQPPGESGKLYFAPTQAAEGYSKRPATGNFNAEGRIRVMSWEPDDGLVPGHYTVSVQPDDLNTSRIPEGYQQAGSGLEVTVTTDQRQIEFNVDISLH